MARSIGFKKISIDIPMAGQRVPLSATSIKVPWFELYCASTNGGSIYLGDSTVNSTWIPRAASSNLTFTASNRGDLTEGDWFDLSKIYVTCATAGDDVIIVYPYREP